MGGPRVLLVLSAHASWSRGILRGFSSVAHEHGWDLLHYYPGMSLPWLARMWQPEVTVLGPEVRDGSLASDCSGIVLSVNEDRTSEGVASVCLDERQIASAAFQHLRDRGLPCVTTFRFDASPFAVVREQAFREAAIASALQVAPGWWPPAPLPPDAQEDPATISSWLAHLPRPCGVFACCDAWALVVLRYARALGLRVPEDVAILGVDNDATACELPVPPLSSVSVPWQRVGRQAAELVRAALTDEPFASARVVIGPGPVVTRRSTDHLAIEDDLVARAVRWIHENSDRALTVPSVARAVATHRRRLERRFHAVLGRTVLQEIRRVRVESAKRLLSTTRHRLPRVAKLCGFSSAALLSVAFRKELGVPPGAYRRQVQGSPQSDE